MSRTRNLALIYGGDSSEWEISVLSGVHVATHINRDKYQVFEVLIRGNDWRVVKAPDGSVPQEKEANINKIDFSWVWSGEKIFFEVALIMIHGTPGEDGVLQSYFESLHIPYTSSSSSVSALAFDKYACKQYLSRIDVPMGKGMVLGEREVIDEQKIIDTLGLPLFVKPNCGGSSFGISKIKRKEELKPALERAFKECSWVLIEEFITGRELTNGMLRTATQRVVLPVTEIVSKNDFFDYQAKYQGASKEITPAPIPDTLRDRVQQITSNIYDFLECRGFIRVDYIAKDHDVVFLEVNTIPGMTQMSLVPQQVLSAGMTMDTFLELLIEDAILRHDR